jgi:hypothetical protein
LELYRHWWPVVDRRIVVGMVDDIVRVVSPIKRDFGVADKAEMIHVQADLHRESKKVERVLRALTWSRNLFWWRSLHRGDDR